MTKEEVISKLYKVLPYNEQIELESVSDKTIMFTWRFSKFRIDIEGPELMVHEREKGFLSGSNLSLLIEHILNKQ